MDFNKLKIFLLKSFKAWIQNVEESRTKMTLWEFIAHELITNDIVKE